MKRLVRFRADPTKVRVAIRVDGEEWLATVSPRSIPDAAWTARSKYPEQAILHALEKAKQLNGVDTHLDEVYDHPYPEVVT